MPEREMLGEFPKCPNCGSKETISNMATEYLRTSGKITADTPTQLRTQFTPLEQPMLASVAVPVVVSYYDICAKCGTERCTRAEKTKAPIQMAAPGGGSNHGHGMPFK